MEETRVNCSSIQVEGVSLHYYRLLSYICSDRWAYDYFRECLTLAVCGSC